MSRTTSFWCRGDNTRLWSRRREFDIILTSFPIDRKEQRYLQRMTSKNCAVTPLHERLSALIPTRSRRAEPLSLSHKLYTIFRTSCFHNNRRKLVRFGFKVPVESFRQMTLESSRFFHELLIHSGWALQIREKHLQEQKARNTRCEWRRQFCFKRVKFLSFSSAKISF